MGTRNLTMVIMNGKTKVAQYGQWDGYPEGQGATALKFLKTILAANELDKFKAALDNVKFISDSEIEARYKLVGGDGGRFVNMAVSERFKQSWPELDRDCAAEVLQLIHDGKATELRNYEDFAGQSLFCEWAYVIDLDKNVFEVYSGFNKQPLTESDRFYKLTNKKEEYKPVKLAASFPLDQLPEEKEFIAQFESVEENEDAE